MEKIFLILIIFGLILNTEVTVITFSDIGLNNITVGSLSSYQAGTYFEYADEGIHNVTFLIYYSGDVSARLTIEINGIRKSTSIKSGQGNIKMEFNTQLYKNNSIVLSIIVIGLGSITILNTSKIIISSQTTLENAQTHNKDRLFWQILLVVVLVLPFILLIALRNRLQATTEADTDEDAAAISAWL